MKHFVNEFDYTPELMRECTGAWWDGKTRQSNLVAIFLAIAIALFSCVLYRRPAMLVLLILPLAIPVMAELKKRRAVKTELDRLKVLNPEGFVRCRVSLGDTIRFHNGRGEAEISYSDVESMCNTQHMIVLFVKGSMTVPLKKDSFTEGDMAECIAFLRRKIPAAK